MRRHPCLLREIDLVPSQKLGCACRNGDGSAVEGVVGLGELQKIQRHTKGPFREGEGKTVNSASITSEEAKEEETTGGEGVASRSS